MAEFKVESKQLHCPPIEDTCQALLNGLTLNFEFSSAEVVQCPNLSEPPWSASSPGLCGSTRLGEVGGVKYMFPSPQKDKIYNLKRITELCNLPEGFILGAGAGPSSFVGTNCELIVDMSPNNNQSKTAIVHVPSGKCLLKSLPSEETNCGILCNFFISEGHAGKVIHVKAKNRKGNLDFISCMRKTLQERYGEKSIGFGGIFRVLSGTVKVHVMPDFSETPLKTDCDIDNWLHYYDVKDPMTFMSVFISNDAGLEIRLEHSHGYGSTYGGHYHYDVTPDEVEYEGYFSLANEAYRIDRPNKI